MYKLVCKDRDGDEMFVREFETREEVRRALSHELEEDTKSGELLAYKYEVYRWELVPFTLNVSVTLDC